MGLRGTFVFSPFQITTTSLTAATIGTPYRATLAASGGPTPFTGKATRLPKGLKVGSKTDVISGTVTDKHVAPGNFTVTGQG